MNSVLCRRYNWIPCLFLLVSIIWGRQDAYTSMNIILPLCPVQCIPPPTVSIPLTRVFPPGFLASSPSLFLVRVHLTLFLAHALRLYHFSLFSVIFFVTGSTFADPFTCSFLILSFFVTPHIHLSILISFTSSLVSWLLVVDRVSDPYTNAGFSTVLYIGPFSFS